MAPTYEKNWSDSIKQDYLRFHRKCGLSLMVHGAGLRIDSVFFLNCNQNSKNSNFKELLMFSKNADNFIQLYNL